MARDPRDVPEAVVEDCVHRLWREPALVALVEDRWALRREELARWQLGWDGERVTIPIRVHGRVRDVRRHLLSEVSPAVSYDARPRPSLLWPLDQADRARELWWATDEPDALCLRRLGLCVFAVLPGLAKRSTSYFKLVARIARGRRLRVLCDRLIELRGVSDFRGLGDLKILRLYEYVSVRPRARDVVRLLGWDLARFLTLAATTPSERPC